MDENGLRQKSKTSIVKKRRKYENALGSRPAQHHLHLTLEKIEELAFCWTLKNSED